LTDDPDLADAQTRPGKCGACHAVHNASGPVMWAATDVAPDSADAFCLQCHEAGGAAGAPVPPVRHPAGADISAQIDPRETKLALFDDTGHQADDGLLACSTCHDVHAGADAGPPFLLRQSDDPTVGSICLQCHPDMRTITTSLHNERTMLQHFDVGSPCGPCHVIHARPGMPATGMWAAPSGPEDLPVHIRRCIGCHGLDGPATPMTVPDHPPLPMQNVYDPVGSAFLPLVDELGAADSNGLIGCVTCHLSHGRAAGGGLPAIEPNRMTPQRHQALKTLLRPYRAPNLCTTCHGFDGLRRFLYYHENRIGYHESSSRFRETD
jgi:predicted CXXCH cytochrome family protein